MSKKIRHIYCFSFYNADSPSTRYRAIQTLRFLKHEHGISYTHVIPGYSFPLIIQFIKSYIEVLFFRRKASLILFQKIYSSGLYSTLLKVLLLLRKSSTVYDIDDAEYLRFRERTIHFFMKNAQTVFAGSHELEKYALKFNSSVILMTSPLLHSRHIKQERNEVFTIGWIGDYGKSEGRSAEYSHKNSLNQLLFPALTELTIPSKLVLIGINEKKEQDEVRAKFKSIRDLSIEFIQPESWHDDDQLFRYISKFDVGISPLVDHAFNRAKSAFKMKQYFACGVPVLASPVGENNYFLMDGVNGFFCNHADDFRDKINVIAMMDKMQYSRMSEACLDTVTQFDLQHYSSELFRNSEWLPGIRK